MTRCQHIASRAANTRHCDVDGVLSKPNPQITVVLTVVEVTCSSILEAMLCKKLFDLLLLIIRIRHLLQEEREQVADRPR